MDINKKKFVEDICNHEPKEITILMLKDFISFNSFVSARSALLYKKYKDKKLLDIARSARKNKHKFENLNITDTEEISKCCYESRRLYISFKILRKELKNNETCIF
ncbi:MAG: hypothetical protein RR942_01425 [Romboutsia sp.]